MDRSIRKKGLSSFYPDVFCVATSASGYEGLVAFTSVAPTVQLWPAQSNKLPSTPQQAASVMQLCWEPSENFFATGRLHILVIATVSL